MLCAVGPLDQFDRVQAIGLGDQRADDLLAQMSRECGAVHVLYRVVWMAATMVANIACAHTGCSAP